MVRAYVVIVILRQFGEYPDKQMLTCLCSTLLSFAISVLRCGQSHVTEVDSHDKFISTVDSVILFLNGRVRCHSEAVCDACLTPSATKQLRLHGTGTWSLSWFLVTTFSVGCGKQLIRFTAYSTITFPVIIYEYVIHGDTTSNVVLFHNRGCWIQILSHATVLYWSDCVGSLVRVRCVIMHIYKEHNGSVTQYFPAAMLTAQVWFYIWFCTSGYIATPVEFIVIMTRW